MLGNNGLLKQQERVHAAIASLLEREDVLILDTETTGLGQAEVIEVSIINTCGKVLLDTLVRPKATRMNPYAQRVHGITMPMLEHAPHWPEVLPELRRLTERATVLAWNASFDARMLEQSSELWGLTHPRILFACAMQMYAQLKGMKRTALHKALVAEGLHDMLERHASHRALGDVHFVLGVLQRCTLEAACKG